MLKEKSRCDFGPSQAMVVLLVIVAGLWHACRDTRVYCARVKVALFGRSIFDFIEEKKRGILLIWRVFLMKRKSKRQSPKAQISPAHSITTPTSAATPDRHT
jgi:hypothetical protein